MVKGRRKRAPVAANSQIAKISPLNESNGSIISPLKKEMKLDKNSLDHHNNRGATKTRNNATKAASCVTIASYFPKKKEDLSNDKNDADYNSLTNCMTPERVLYQNGQDCTIGLDDSIKELFKTDETPVAVPCQNPSTPHRINMPTVQNDYPLDKAFTANSKDIKLSDPADIVKQSVGKKIGGGRVRGKAKFSSPKHRSAEVQVASLNHKVTEYFPVRRSVRKSKKTVLEEKQRLIETKVFNQTEEGLEVKHFVGKGRGVVTTREFTKGEFVVEYIGELIDQVTAKKREAEYAKDHNTGCYMYYFQHRNQQYCVDATAETKKLGRLVNHSRNGNLIARVVEVESIPHLVLTAKEDIPIGVEITYDYGDRSRESIRNHPWLAL